MARIARVGVFAVGAWLLLSAPAAAQTLPTAIAGVVRDTSGAVMPGVTVEAASDALIEKVRTVVSDEHGEYKIIDLRPGTYTVTFSLTGFSSFRREQVELPTGFTAKIDAELRVGALEETLTVTGVSPVVDVQSTSQTKVVSGEMLYALPMTKEMGGLAKVTVGVMIPPTAQDVGGNIDPMNAYPVIHGGHTGRQSRPPRRHAIQRRRTGAWLLLQPGRRTGSERPVGRPDRRVRERRLPGKHGPERRRATASREW